MLDYYSDDFQNMVILIFYKHHRVAHIEIDQFQSNNCATPPVLFLVNGKPRIELLTRAMKSDERPARLHLKFAMGSQYLMATLSIMHPLVH